MSQQPAVGRIVHYMARGSADGKFPPVCRAAVITEVPQPDTDDFNHERVGLAVLNPTGLFFDRGLDHDEDTKPGGTWHWPEYVPGYAPPTPVGAVPPTPPHPSTTSTATAGTSTWNVPATQLGSLIPEPDRTPGPSVP